MALSGQTLDEVVKPDMKQDWDEVKKSWFPRDDTAENQAYDKRTPGKTTYRTCYVL